MAATSTTSTMGDEASNGENPPQSSAELDAFVEDMLEQMVRRINHAPYSLLRSVSHSQSPNLVYVLTLLIHCALRIVTSHSCSFFRSSLLTTIQQTRFNDMGNSIFCKFCRAVHSIPSNDALTSSSIVHTFSKDGRDG
jgi:hypothetical protein